MIILKSSDDDDDNNIKSDNDDHITVCMHCKFYFFLPNIVKKFCLCKSQILPRMENCSTGSSQLITSILDRGYRIIHMGLWERIASCPLGQFLLWKMFRWAEFTGSTYCWFLGKSFKWAASVLSEISPTRDTCSISTIFFHRTSALWTLLPDQCFFLSSLVIRVNKYLTLFLDFCLLLIKYSSLSYILLFICQSFVYGG